MYRYLYNYSGRFVPFLYEQNVFAPNTRWLGCVVDGNQIYSPNGTFVGSITVDDTDLRSSADWQRGRATPPHPPAPPDASTTFSPVNGIAGRCAFDRQKHDQPWAVFMGSADGVRSLVVSLLPNCLWAFPGGKGN